MKASGQRRITAELLLESWEKITTKLPNAEGRSFLEISLTDGSVSLSAVVRVADSMPGLLLRLPATPMAEKWTARQFAGVKFENAVNLEPGLGLPLILADLDAKEIFAALAEDIASAIACKDTLEEKLTNVFGRLSLWRRFFTTRTARLSEEEVRGIIGELSVLDRVISERGVDFALDAWKGPKGELHDFRFPSFRLEVKAWTNSSLPRIYISDPSQIVVDSINPIWVAAVQISKDHISGRRLAEWIDSIGARLAPSQKELYEVLLADCGYLLGHFDYYPDRYSVVATLTYVVASGFPRIDPVTVPPGVCAIKYAIELNALASYSAALPPL